jgi:hypothetical protein
VRKIIKPQRIRNLGNVPIGLFKQDLGFLYYTVADDLRGGVAGDFL